MQGQKRVIFWEFDGTLGHRPKILRGEAVNAALDNGIVMTEVHDKAYPGSRLATVLT